MVPQTGAPRAVRLAGLVVGVEGTALVVVAAGLAVATVLGNVESLGRAGFGVLIGLAAGAGLLRVAVALAGAEGWARAPAVVVQLLLAPVGYTVAFSAERPAYGVPILVLCAAELFLLFTPDSRAAFLDR